MEERILNYYYNLGGFNRPDRIGYMMNMIRQVHPFTEAEWRVWYLDNVHGETYIESLAQEMKDSIPMRYNPTVCECKDYICDVMFRRTFQGYDKENKALRVLREEVSPRIQESPEDWDTMYFIDFFVQSESGVLIGIQLKPETFFLGGYHNVVDIEGKMDAFREDLHALAYILIYRQDEGNGIEFVNWDVIDKIQEEILT